MAEWDAFNLVTRNKWADPCISEGLALSLFIYKKDLQDEVQNFYYFNRQISRYISQEHSTFMGVRDAAQRIFDKELETLSLKEAIIIYTLFEPTTFSNNANFEMNRCVKMNEQRYTQSIK